MLHSVSFRSEGSPFLIGESLLPQGEPVRSLIGLVERQRHGPVLLLRLFDLCLCPLVDRSVVQLNEREAGDRKRREDAGAQALCRFARWAVGVDGAPDLPQAERRGFTRRRRVLRGFGRDEFVALGKAGAGMRIEGGLVFCDGFQRFAFILPLILSPLLTTLGKGMAWNGFCAGARTF